MDRLKSALFVVCTCLSIAPVYGQQTVQDSYVLAGDVQTPQVHAYAAGTRISVQGLLVDAQQAGVRGTAIVLRGQPLALAATEICPQGSSQSTELLPGDIVIFRTLQGWNSPQQNVVRVANNSVEVLAFQTGTQFTLGQIFQTDTPPSVVTVHRTGFGPSSKLTLSSAEPLQHGDVVIVDDPATSLNSLTENTHENSLSVSPASTQTTIDDSNFLTIPGMGTSDDEIHSVSAPTESAADTPFEVSPFDAAIPPEPLVSEPEPATEANENVATGSTDMISGGAAEQGTSSAEAFWNGLFVLGVVLALGLIVVGWVKTQQEQQLERETSARLKDSLTRSSTISSVGEQPNATADAVNADSIALALDTIEVQPELAAIPGGVLDSPDPTEPFSEELSNPFKAAAEEPSEKAAEVNDDCPVLSAGYSPEGLSHAESEGVGLSDLSVESQAQQIAALPQTDTLRQLVAPTEWFGDDWRKPIAEEPQDLTTEPELEELFETQPVSAVEVTVEKPASTARSADDDVDDTEVEVLRQRHTTPPADLLASFPRPETELNGYSSPQPPSEERQLIEDLIENRIPVNLQQADLPLSVSLFGKPTGPKRLRIDAAHSEIAPPHMMKKSRRRQRTQPAAAKESASAPPSDDSVGAGLDKALNYIDEQLDR